MPVKARWILPYSSSVTHSENFVHLFLEVDSRPTRPSNRLRIGLAKILKIITTCYLHKLTCKPTTAQFDAAIGGDRLVPIGWLVLDELNSLSSRNSREIDFEWKISLKPTFNGFRWPTRTWGRDGVLERTIYGGQLKSGRLSSITFRRFQMDGAYSGNSIETFY